MNKDKFKGVVVGSATIASATHALETCTVELLNLQVKLDNLVEACKPFLKINEKADYFIGAISGKDINNLQKAVEEAEEKR